MVVSELIIWGNCFIFDESRNYIKVTKKELNVDSKAKIILLSPLE